MASRFTGFDNYSPKQFQLDRNVTRKAEKISGIELCPSVYINLYRHSRVTYRILFVAFSIIKSTRVEITTMTRQVLIKILAGAIRAKRGRCFI